MKVQPNNILQFLFHQCNCTYSLQLWAKFYEKISSKNGFAHFEFEISILVTIL